MGDVVIKLHDIARETKDKELSYKIRLLADEISDKIKGKTYGSKHS